MKDLKQCFTTLKKGFPTEEKECKEMPFGESMWEAFNKPTSEAQKKQNIDPNDDKNYLHRKHLKQIVGSMNEVLNGRIGDIIRDKSSNDNDKIVARLTTAWYDEINDNSSKSNEREEQEKKTIWLLEAFLHDVGKALTYAKHPTRGEYLVTRLETEQRDEFIKLLGNGDIRKGEEKFNQIKKIIAFHDRFGVLSTGEASYGILVDILDLGSREIDLDKARKTISHIMILNLIDIDASIGGLYSKKVEIILDDWYDTCQNSNSPLKQSRGDRTEFERLLLELATKNERTITRLARLINESYRSGKKAEETKQGLEFDVSLWPEYDVEDFYGKVQDVVQTAIGINWDEFRKDFAHVVKMDYLLYVTTEIVRNNWEKWKKDKSKNAQEEITDIIVKVVIKLRDQFTRLIRQADTRMRIGIDLSVLRQTPDVTEQIAILLGGDDREANIGLDWLATEASAWPFK